MHALFMEGEAHDRVHRICAELGLSPPLLKAFVHLGASPTRTALRMSDSPRPGAATRPTSPALADGLQERGLAERRPHPTDRRREDDRAHAEGRAKRARALELLRSRRRRSRRSPRPSSVSCATCWASSLAADPELAPKTASA